MWRSSATSTAPFAPWMSAMAKPCGRQGWAPRSKAIPSPSAWTANSMSQWQNLVEDKAGHHGQRLSRHLQRGRQTVYRNGKTLRKTRLGTTVQGYPVTFSVDGKQYVAVTTGLGGGSPEAKPSTMLREVHRPPNGYAVFVFGLPDDK